MLTLFLFSMMLTANPGAQEVWEVPDEARAMENPVPLSDEALAAGEADYGKRCASCHGDVGKGDGKATRFIKPAPADISTAEARDRMTDGEIFFKITEGKKPMPGMARTLSDEERWQVVHYLRTLQPPR
jgi:mono/diheme cytochrome c family protein